MPSSCTVCRRRGQVQTTPSVSSTSTSSSSPPMLGCCRTSDRRGKDASAPVMSVRVLALAGRVAGMCACTMRLCVSRMSRCILRPTSSPLRPHAYPTLWFAGRPRWRGDGQLSSHQDQPPPGGRPRGFAMSCVNGHVACVVTYTFDWCLVATVPVYVAYPKTQSFKNAIFFRHVQRLNLI